MENELFGVRRCRPDYRTLEGRPPSPPKVGNVFASFKDKTLQAKVWMVASGQFMVDILVLAAQVLPAYVSLSLFPSPSSLPRVVV